MNRLQWQIVIVSVVIIFLFIVSQSPKFRIKIRNFIGDDSAIYYHQTFHLPPNDKILTHSLTEVNGEYMGYSLQSMQIKKLPHIDIVKKRINSAMINCSHCHKK